jgi:hypothetical protein
MEIQRYSYLVPSSVSSHSQALLGMVFLKRYAEIANSDIYIYSGKNHNPIDLCVVMKTLGFLTMMEFMLPRQLKKTWKKHF